MNKKVIILLLLTFVIVGCKSFPKPNCSDDFLQSFEKAVENENLSFCKEEFVNRNYKNLYDYPICSLKNGSGFTPSDCVIAMAEKTQNIILCNKEEWFGRISAEHEIRCLSKIKGLENNPEWCEELKSITKKYCLSYISITNDDLDLCKELNKPGSSGVNCITPLAIKRNNVSICDIHLNSKGFGDLDRKHCIEDFEEATK